MDKEFIKTVLFLVVTIGLLFVGLCTPVGSFFSRDSIIGYIQPMIEIHKLQAVVIFIAAMTLLPMLWVPRLVMTAVAGALFGLEEGFIYAMIGSTTAGLIGYWFAQSFTSRYFEQKIEGNTWISRLDFTRKNAFWLILLARICPVTHYEVINYLCGTSNVRFWTFFWSTFLGIIPGTFVYVMMGDAVLQFGWWSPELRLTLYILGVFLLATMSGFYWIIRNGQQAAGVASMSKTSPENEPHGIEQVLILLLAIALSCCLYLPSIASAEEIENFTATTVSVADGDTITVVSDRDGKRYKIRLKGIDCPETEHGGREHGQDFGEEAKRFTGDFALKQQVSVQVYGKDRYQRLLAVISRGEQVLNLELVKAGLAYVFVFGKESPLPGYLEAETEARKSQRGFWKATWQIRPKLYRRYSSLKQLETDYQGDSTAVRKMPFPRLILFPADGDPLEKLAEARRKAGKTGRRYLALGVDYSDENGSRWLGIPMIDRPGKKFPYPVHEMGRGEYAGLLDRTVPPASSMDTLVQGKGWEASGPDYIIHWVDGSTLEHAGLPADETLVERLRPLK